MSKSRKQLVLVERAKVPLQSGCPSPEVPFTYAGLCSSCIHSPYCTFRRFTDQAIIHCEEWSVEIASCGTLGTSRRSEAPARTAVLLNSTRSQPKGLCATCEEHPTCSFAKPEGGVWHCEEYR
jgi:hypothetical protein